MLQAKANRTRAAKQRANKQKAAAAKAKRLKQMQAKMANATWHKVTKKSCASNHRAMKMAYPMTRVRHSRFYCHG